MSDFIEVKSPKAKGKRFATWEVAKIEDITPEPEPEPEPEEEEVDGENGDANEGNEGNEAPVVDVPFTITNEVPEDSKPVDEQLSLF